MRRIIAAAAIAAMSATTAMAQMAPAEPEAVVVPTEPAPPRDSLQAALFPLIGFLVLIALAMDGGDSGGGEPAPQ